MKAKPEPAKPTVKTEPEPAPAGLDNEGTSSFKSEGDLLMDGFDEEGSMQAAVAPVPSQQSLPGRDRRAWLVTIPLALIVSYAFIPVLANGFMALWDDHENFLDNPYFRGLGAVQLKWAWTTMWVRAYQPLAWMLFETEYVFWQLDPRGYHLTSLLLQVASAVVLYVLTAALLVRCDGGYCLESPWTCSLSAGLATALFAVHPLRVEVVASASCQPYLPCTLFCMLAVLAYLRAFPMRSSPRWGWLVGSFLLFVGALLFKAPAVSLPAVLLIIDVYPLRRFPDDTGRWFGASARRALLEKVPFVMMSILFMGLAIAAKPQSQIPLDRDSAWGGIARACHATWFYPFETVFPLNLIPSHPSPMELKWLAPPAVRLTILTTLALSAGLFLVRRRWPGLLAAWLCYLVILAPTSGLISISDQVAGDRYSYLCLLSLVTPAAVGFCRLWRMSSRWRPAAIGLIAIGLGSVLALTAMTRKQCLIWRDSDTLTTYALTHGLNSYFWVHHNLGIGLDKLGRYDEAVAHLSEAVQLNPDDDVSHINLGRILCRRGRYAEAEAHFAEVARLHPGDDKAQNEWGKVVYTLGKYEEAVPHFSAALRLNPGDADAHNNLGVVLDKQGKYEEAVAHFTEALRLNPGFADAHNNLATILSSRGKYAEAEAHFAEVARLRPRDDKAHNNLGNVLSKRGKYEEAAAQFIEALRLNPNSVDSHYNLGLAFSHRGNYEEAKAELAEAIRLEPGDPKAYNARR